MHMYIFSDFHESTELVALYFVTSIQWHDRNVAILVATDWRRTLPINVKYIVQTRSFRLWYDPIPGISSIYI